MIDQEVYRLLRDWKKAVPDASFYLIQRTDAQLRQFETEQEKFDTQLKVLDEIIELIKKEFPLYNYINNLKNPEKYPFGNTCFAIVIEEVEHQRYKDFMAFIDAMILSPRIDIDLELPLIIPFFKNDNTNHKE